MTRVMAVLLALGLSAAAAAAQQPDPPTRAFDLERRGRHQEAAQLYREILAGRPADIGALLGLERSLTAQTRLGDMVKETAEAIQTGEPSAGLFGIAVRVYTAAGWPDSARKAVESWARLEPNSEGPYQEWGAAALAVRERPLARSAYRLGRERLGAGALAGELAQLATIEGDFEVAVDEWMAAVKRVPGYRAAAVSMLSQMSVSARPGVLRALDRQRAGDAERIAAALTIRWGDPVGGIRRLERGLPMLGDDAADALQELMDELRGQRGREPLMARAIGLELLGRRMPGQATRFWLEAAQAYADAGDQQSARRMLSQLAGDPAASQAMAASATSTLVSVLVAEGKMDEASQQFEQLRSVLGLEEREELARRMAEGWIEKGDLERAAAAVATDSTVDGLALRGRIQLYRGDIRGAADHLRFAGPFAGQREAAVSRTTALSLLQVLEADSLPALGAGLLALERRDSLAAVGHLEPVAGMLPPEKGGAEVLLLVARVLIGLRNTDEAERLLGVVAGLEVPASAAQAELELARLHLAKNRQPLAIDLLEHLLVTYPASAVVPQARRLLDVAKGAVPPSGSTRE